MPASATSDVPVRYRSSFSSRYRFDSSVGRNPVPYMARSPTMIGGSTVMKPWPRSLCSTNWYSAISVTATSPIRYANREPDSRAPLTMSIQPRSDPSSRWSFGSKPNSGCSPTVLTTWASSSSMPSAAVGSGRFGIRARISSLCWAATACCWRAVSILADSSLSAASSSGLGLPLDALFCSARRDSARSVCSRQLASAASSSSKSFAASRLASAARNASGFCRAALRSITLASLVARGCPLR